jgi:hypothetical protein
MMRPCHHHDVRTTLTLDDDVSTLLEKEMRRTGQSLKQTVNQLLRFGLQQSAAPTPVRPFRIKAKKVGLPSEWTSGSVSELIEMLDGPQHR